MWLPWHVKKSEIKVLADLKLGAKSRPPHNLYAHTQTTHSYTYTLKKTGDIWRTALDKHENRGQQVCPSPQRESSLNSRKSTSKINWHPLTLEGRLWRACVFIEMTDDWGSSDNVRNIVFVSANCITWMETNVLNGLFFLMDRLKDKVVKRQTDRPVCMWIFRETGRERQIKGCDICCMSKGGLMAQGLTGLHYSHKQCFCLDLISSDSFLASYLSWIYSRWKGSTGVVSQIPTVYDCFEVEHRILPVDIAATGPTVTMHIGDGLHA